MPNIKDWLLLLFGFDWLNIILVAAIGGALLLLMWWQMRRGDGFDLRDLVAEKVVPNVAQTCWVVRAGKFWQAACFVVTTWGFIYVVTHDKLTELYLFVYVGLWGGSTALNQFAAAKWGIKINQAQAEPANAEGTKP